ncbi:Hypothetical predicted protein [Cloeon dipterum]|uniref:CUB domain-containing protein n=1 Tax=Cloeon dipterum TaxID=197152 RepID=A0A8S1D1H4_9INSE|nr:Hypothetical predicted protein [Cloeon dipterum]
MERKYLSSTFYEFPEKEEKICLRGDFVKAFLSLEKGGEVNEKTAWSHVLCGELSEVPHRLYSSGHVALLEFHTDHRPSNHSGFMGTFRFLDRRLELIIHPSSLGP